MQIKILKQELYNGRLIYISAVYTYRMDYRSTRIVVHRFTDKPEITELDDLECSNLQNVLNEIY